MSSISCRVRNFVALLTVILSFGALVACSNEGVATSSVPTASPTFQVQPSPTTALTTTVVSATATTSAQFTAAVISTPGGASNDTSIVTIKDFHSSFLNNDRQVDIFLPPDYNTATTRYKVLYMNDGNFAYTYNVNKLLDKLYSDNQLEKIIVVAIFSTSARNSEYGVAGIPGFDSVGDKADLYSKFVIEELLPYIKKNYRIQEGPANTAIMGFSLGGLMAFDLAWQHPDLFGKVGVFSGSFWVRTDNESATTRQNSRIMHKVVRESPKRVGLKMWFYAGTKEETDDRDGNGVIDMIQDTTELIDVLKTKGYQLGTDIVYTQIVGGTHSGPSWFKVLPDFLKSAFQ